jgi:hypothetical protein
MHESCAAISEGDTQSWAAFQPDTREVPSEIGIAQLDRELVVGDRLAVSRVITSCGSRLLAPSRASSRLRFREGVGHLGPPRLE